MVFKVTNRLHKKLQKKHTSLTKMDRFFTYVFDIFSETVVLFLGNFEHNAQLLFVGQFIEIIGKILSLAGTFLLIGLSITGLAFGLARSSVCLSKLRTAIFLALRN